MDRYRYKWIFIDGQCIINFNSIDSIYIYTPNYKIVSKIELRLTYAMQVSKMR